MTLIEMLRANGSWEADAAAKKLQSQTDRIEKLENENQDMSIHLEAMVAEVERLRKSLTTRFARSSPVEEKLMAAGIGKREMPTKEECLEWAAKLGVPDEYRGGVK